MILTLNFRQALDQAFTRRLRFVVHFAFPDSAQRAAIWARAFPSRVPVRDLNLAALARLAVTGGSIRNIAIAAAFQAADAGQPITGAHLLQAAASGVREAEQDADGFRDAGVMRFETALANRPPPNHRGRDQMSLHKGPSSASTSPIRWRA